MNRRGKLKAILRVAPRRPREFGARVATFLEGTWDRVASRLPEYETLTPEAAVVALGERLPAVELGAESWSEELASLDDEVSTSLSRLPSSEPIAFSHCAVRSLARCAYILCRALRPRTVIETGVAYGVTTTYLLHALQRNGQGRLFSIDLPPLGDEAGRHVGQLVEPSVRDRWTLLRGTSRQVLPGLLRELGAVHLFVHDSLHTYRTMMWEFRTIWPYLEQRGVLVSDDVDGNRAFPDFARSVEPLFGCVVHDDAGNGSFGIILK